MTMVVDSLSQVILQKSKMVSGSGPWVAMYSLFFSKPMDGEKIRIIKSHWANVLCTFQYTFLDNNKLASSKINERKKNKVNV